MTYKKCLAIANLQYVKTQIMQSMQANLRAMHHNDVMNYGGLHLAIAYAHTDASRLNSSEAIKSSLLSAASNPPRFPQLTNQLKWWSGFTSSLLLII